MEHSASLETGAHLIRPQSLAKRYHQFEMKIIFSIIFYFTTLIVAAQSTDLFYKTVESTIAKDSILQTFKSENLEFIEFSKPCYWQTEDSLNINYCDSYLLVYKDSSGTIHSVFITEFFIFREESTSSSVYEFFQWNAKELIQTELRPDKRDFVRRQIDSSIMESMIDLGYEFNDTLSYADSSWVRAIEPNYAHYNRGTDGLPHQFITISTKDSLTKIAIDQYVLSPSNFYYRYNCKKPIYTLRILLEQEFESMKESVKLHLEMKELGLLDSLGRLDFSSNPKYFEKMYEEQINNWIDEANSELKTNWELIKE